MPFAKECSGCGQRFETDNILKKKCQPGCKRIGKRNPTRTKRRETNDITFVGVDGEGVDRPDGKHEYVMLSVGQETLWNDGKELTLSEILEFLWAQYQKQPDAAYVGFFLNYDFIQWLKLLPEREAYLLFSPKGIMERKSERQGRVNPYPDAVVWEDWEIDIMAGRRFRLRPHVCHMSRYNTQCRNRTCSRDMEIKHAADPVGVHADSNDPAFDFLDNVTVTAVSQENPFAIVRIPESLTRNKHKVDSNGKAAKVSGWMYICDSGPFWQTSFLNVIDPEGWKVKLPDGTYKYDPVCTQLEYATVVDGKQDRGHVYEYGETAYFADMQRYNVLENEILARVTKRLNEGFMNERIPIRIPKTDWYGPGRAAQIWMDGLHELACDRNAREENKAILRNNSVPGNPRRERLNETGLLNVDVYTSMPTWFYDAAKASYYGGWFEQFVHGHVGDVWEYDINSAYPYIIAGLPCLHTQGTHTGAYTEGAGSNYPKDSGNYTILYCTVEGSNPYIGAMPYRNRQGLISRPHKTKGWYWLHEVEASKRAGLIDNVVIENWVSYKPCTCTPPFNPESIGIEALYQLRLDFGKNTPQGKSAKLVYNSAYGKTAQSIGQPKYSNPVYASLITAGCRTLILQAIANHPMGPKAVTMVATDGVYFIGRHPGLAIDPERLGAWDETFKPGLTQLMPGVYWDDKTRERLKAGESPKLKSRGVSARDLAKEINMLDYLFAVQEESLRNGGEYVWPELEFSTAFVLESCKSALNRGKWGDAGKVSHGAKRSISSDPKTKRQSTPYACPETDLTRSRPYSQGESIETTPYEKSFGYMEDVPDMFNGMVDRDGRAPQERWRELLRD